MRQSCSIDALTVRKCMHECGSGTCVHAENMRQNHGNKNYSMFNYNLFVSNPTQIQRERCLFMRCRQRDLDEMVHRPPHSRGCTQKPNAAGCPTNTWVPGVTLRYSPRPLFTDSMCCVHRFKSSGERQNRLDCGSTVTASVPASSPSRATCDLMVNGSGGYRSPPSPASTARCSLTWVVVVSPRRKFQSCSSVWYSSTAKRLRQRPLRPIKNLLTVCATAYTTCDGTA